MWYKDGRRLYRSTRVSILTSGDLVIPHTRRHDSGLYTCEAVNEQGVDMASSYVTVGDYTSGCADGSAHGLRGHKHLQACNGTWQGHVRSARSPCAKGWR